MAQRTEEQLGCHAVAVRAQPVALSLRAGAPVSHALR